MSSRRQIFRQAALDRLASPEQVDRPLRVVSGAGWLALAVFLMGLGGFLAWFVKADAPVKVQALGIMISAGGLDQIVAGTQGRLKTLDVQPGDTVTAGQVVATFRQTELGRELETARARLLDTQQRFKQLTNFYDENERREALLETERIGTIKQTRKLLRQRLGLLNKKYDSLSRLLKKKVITDEELIQVQLDLSLARERLAQLDDEEKAIAVRKQERLSEQQLQLLDEELAIKQYQREVERLQARLGEQLNLTSPHEGRVVEVMVNAGEVVQPGTALATIAPLNTDAAALTAYIYVSPADGKRIRSGMQVQLNPSAFRPEKYGYMLGEVQSVSELPATLEGMRRVLKNEQLARELTRTGVPFEVRVSLKADPSTPSGYRWSSSQGPDAEINAGMLLDAQVIVERLRLINLAIPQFDRVVAKLGG